MTKRISIIAAGLVVVVIIILVVLLTTQDIFNLTGTEEENDRQMISTALIQRKDLRTFEKIDGVLEYGSEIQVLPSNNGVLTYIIAEGEDIFRGTLLFKYYKSVTETEMLTAENQIASADSAVAQAEATLVTSNSSVDTQWVTFRIARQSYCDLSGKLGSSVWTAQVYKSVCPDSENAMTVTAAGLLLNSIFDEPQLVTSGNELLIAYENYKKGLETQISASKALESAKAQRRVLDEAATVADLNNANKALESAKASLRLAEHNSDELIGMMMATVAMYGEHPAWRSFETGMSAGDDIYQLEQNLVSLGYDKDKSILIDREFDENTHKAVEAMQSLMGVSVTGKLSFKDILFIPGPSVVQYSSSHTELGSMIVTTNPVLGLIPIEKVIEKSGEPEVTKSLQKVNSSIEVANQDLVGVGLSVSIELPDENIIAGTISDIGEIAVIPLGNQGEPYLEIVIAIDEVESFPEWTGATVTVSVTKKLASDVLAAPVTSLLAVLGGGYAIEIIENGLTKLVPVSVGLYADGYVEIDGDGIKEGTEVIVP